MSGKQKRTPRPKPGTKSSEIRPGLGYSPAKVTAAAAGTHGGSPRAKNRRQRREARRQLKDL